MSNFKIGEKVVFVDDSNIDYTRGMRKAKVVLPKIGEIYTVRGYALGGNSIYLEEIKNPIMNTFYGFLEQAFKTSRFRKLDHQFGEDVCAEIIKQVKEEELILTN